MDPVKDDRGQALLFAVLLLGLAAVAIVGLRGVADRMLERVLDDRAGEAAVAAAAAGVADLARERERAAGHELTAAETAAFAADDAVASVARGAASRLARLHGRADPSDVRILSFGSEIEVHLTLAGQRHIALLAPPP